MVVSVHVKTTVLRGLFPTSGVAGVCWLNSHAGPHVTRSDSHIRACRDSHVSAPTHGSGYHTAGPHGYTRSDSHIRACRDSHTSAHTHGSGYHTRAYSDSNSNSNSNSNTDSHTDSHTHGNAPGGRK